MRALRHLRELVRVAEENEVPRGRADRDRIRQRELPGLVDEERVHVPGQLLAREQPRRSGDQVQVRVEHGVVRARVLDHAALELGVGAGRLLQTADLDALLGRGGLDLLEMLVDRLVAERGDADAPPRPHERDRHAAAVPRLARAGRPLHEEVAPVEAERGVDRRAVEARPRRPALEHVDHGRVRVRILGEAEHRVPLHFARRAAAAGSGRAAAAHRPA